MKGRCRSTKLFTKLQISGQAFKLLLGIAVWFVDKLTLKGFGEGAVFRLVAHRTGCQ